MLLYMIVKNHSFVDGNKRIAASCFLYFLNRNKMLYKIELKDWLAYMGFVGKDYVGAACMHADEDKKDYIYTRKERRQLQ